jgi:HD-GYP domain-containing protein (c-di-GMP phosphodiesterase class II)
MAVADCYDAMTSNRAYRPAMTQEQALLEIRRVSGTQLDADMAEAFARAVEAGEQAGGLDEA